MHRNKALDQTRDILLKRAQVQRHPPLHQSLRAVIGSDVRPTGRVELASERLGKRHGFYAAAFLGAQLEGVDVVIKPAFLNVFPCELDGKENSLLHAVVAPIALLQLQGG